MKNEKSEMRDMISIELDALLDELVYIQRLSPLKGVGRGGVRNE